MLLRQAFLARAARFWRHIPTVGDLHWGSHCRCGQRATVSGKRGAHEPATSAIYHYSDKPKDNRRER